MAAAEEMGNIGLTLCYQMDTMLNRYLKLLQERLMQLEAENAQLKQQLSAALDSNRQWQAAYEELKQRALTKIGELQQKLGDNG